MRLVNEMMVCADGESMFGSWKGKEQKHKRNSAVVSHQGRRRGVKEKYK